MGRRNDHSREELRELALSAAEAIIDDQAGGGLTARRIAERIGYTVGTLYLVFENLDDLTLQVNGRTLEELRRVARQARDGASDPADAVRAIGHAYVEFAEAHRGRWRYLFQPRQAPDEPFPPWYLEKIRVLFDLIETPLLALEPDPGAAAAGARALWGAVHGICTLADNEILDVGSLPERVHRPTSRDLAARVIDRYLAPYRPTAPEPGPSVGSSVGSSAGASAAPSAPEPLPRNEV